MTGIFTMAGMAYAIKQAGDVVRRPGPPGISTLQTKIKILENNLSKALMINEVLWEFIREKHNLTEDDLNEKLYMVDMRDGQLNGKNQRTSTIECPKCHRMVSARHSACIYCSHVIDESIFSIT